MLNTASATLGLFESDLRVLRSGSMTNNGTDQDRRIRNACTVKLDLNDYVDIMFPQTN